MKQTITIAGFIRSVKLADKRAAKYYQKGDTIPKRLKDHGFDSKGFLINRMGQKVVKNIRTVGTPRMLAINGQALYNGTMHPRVRSVLVEKVKEYMAGHLKGIKPVPKDQLPVLISCRMYEQVGLANWDLDNLWLYTKCMQDVLVANGILPDDSIRFVTTPPFLQFVPVDNEADRKLVFTIEKDTRDEIVNHHFYQQQDEPLSISGVEQSGW